MPRLLVTTPMLKKTRGPKATSSQALKPPSEEEEGLFLDPFLQKKRPGWFCLIADNVWEILPLFVFVSVFSSDCQPILVVAVCHSRGSRNIFDDLYDLFL